MYETTIAQEIEIDAPAAHVWRFIGTAEGLRQWWGTNIYLEARQGGRCEERGVIEGIPYHLSGEVTVYDPPSRLRLTMHNGKTKSGDAYHPPLYTTITLTLREQAGRTRVSVEHRRFVPVATPYADTERVPVQPIQPGARHRAGKIAQDPAARVPIRQPVLPPGAGVPAFPLPAPAEVHRNAISVALSNAWAARLSRLQAATMSGRNEL